MHDQARDSWGWVERYQVSRTTACQHSFNASLSKNAPASSEIQMSGGDFDGLPIDGAAYTCAIDMDCRVEDSGVASQMIVQGDSGMGKGSRLVKYRREMECLICLEMTSSGISLPCLHGPFCEACISVW